MSARSDSMVIGALALVLGTFGRPTTANAEEDAGTLSPFAHGAGGRALGMAGAYVACADDASALVWNPGGLARAARFGFEVTSTRFDASEAGETFAALVAPSWRWGTFGVAMRHAGTGGIEQRDEGNALVPGELNAAESELAFGYARAFLPGVTVGAGMKLQRVAIGDLSGTGYGADLGLAVDGSQLGERLAWAAPFAIGVAVRNGLLRPSQRLDQERVSDPSVLRAGLAWRHGLPAAMGLVVAADMSSTSGLPARMHVGGELNLRGLLSLRTGLDDGHLATGSSIRWQGFSIDYVYEQRDVGSAQRIGLSKAIGSTVTERQEAARLAEERDLAARVATEYQRRLGEQVTELLGRAREALHAGALDDAMDAIASARALGPADRGTLMLEATVLCAQGVRQERDGDPAGALLSYRRALESFSADSIAAQGQRRTQAELARIANQSNHSRELDEAYRLFGGGDLIGARTAFGRLATATPRDTVAAAMLWRVDRAIGQRVSALLGKARRDLDAGLLDESQSALDEVRALDHGNADLAQLRTAIDLERRRLRNRIAPPRPIATQPSSSDPSRAQKREAETHYRRGLQLASARQTDGALRLWELALALDRDHQGVRQTLKREYLLRGMAAFGRGRFADAERDWARVVELDPTDVRARGYLERARTQLDRTRELTGADR